MIDTADEPDPPETAPPPAERAAGLGSQLRRVYDDVTHEPLPDMFEDLLRQLQ